MAEEIADNSSLPERNKAPTMVDKCMGTPRITVKSVKTQFDPMQVLDEVEVNRTKPGILRVKILPKKTALISL